MKKVGWFLVFVTTALLTFSVITEAQQAGDWARYGEEIQKLGELLKEMANGQ